MKRFKYSLLLPAITAFALFAMEGHAGRAAQGAFEEELLAQNAHHLKEAISAVHHQSTSMINPGFSGETRKGPWELREGPIRLAVSMQRNPAYPKDPAAPVLSIFVDGRKMLKVDGSAGFAEGTDFLVQIAEMDPDNPWPEIVFSSYTGGAHCCSDTRIITSDKTGKTWRAIDAGMYDGGPLAVSDPDFDGRFELVTRDNAFLYTFGCYACSTAPVIVQQLEKGRLVDASTKKEFRTEHQASLVSMIRRAGDGADANGFLAGYVAQKIRLGEGSEAWKFMLKHYDRKSDWGLEDCSVKLDKDGNCPGTMVSFTFPQALERFLEASGYPVPK